MMTMSRRIARALDRLEARVHERQQRRLDEERQQADVQRRWEETLSRFEALLPNDLLDRVAVALQDDQAGDEIREFREYERCPVRLWIEDVYRGRSRLPECLTEAVMRQLVLTRLDEGDRCSDFDGVCLRCGLQYPMCKLPPISEWRLAPGCSRDEKPLRYDLPHFFDHDGCPACGASSKAGEMTWVHLIEDGFWTRDRHD